MGLLEALGLAPVAGKSTDHASRTAHSESSGDDGDPVVAAHDGVAALLARLPDDKARGALESELAALRAQHARGDDASRTSRRKAELAAAAALHDKAGKLADKAQQAAEFEKTQAEVDAGLSAINALVLGGINNDALRKSINAELTKLNDARTKAAKIAEPRAARAGFAALLKSVQSLQHKAEGARAAVEYSQATLEPMVATASAAIGKLPAGAKAALQPELDALEADRKRFVAAMDETSLQSMVAPRLAKLRDLAVALPTASVRADADLARAAKALAALKGPQVDALQARLKTLQAQKTTGWPAGKTLDEMAASFDAVGKGAAALAAEAEELGPRLQRRSEIAALRKRLDGLKPRTDRAAEPAEATFMAPMHKRVTDALANFTRFEALDDLKSCEILFSNIGAAIDALDQSRDFLNGQRARLAAARNGGIKEALALKLAPASLAALRTKSIEARLPDIEAMIDGGNLVGADKAIETWLQSAKAWGDAPQAYENLRSGKPKLGVMKDLVAKPGGGEVFDALVADLPDKTTSTETMTTALEARFGTHVTQANHRAPGQDFADKNAKYSDPRKETNPKEPQKGLKDLYRVLRMVPLKDAKYTEQIVDYEEDGGGAYYHGDKGEWGAGGSKKDRIVMYVGRPDQADSMVLGGTQAPGQKADPDAQPVDTKPVNAYTQSALHEVGHALDDARNVMAAHMDEAGWQSWDVADVAKKVAEFYSYDAPYAQALMEANPKKPAKAPRRPASVKSDAEWESARKDVEKWVKESVVGANPWDNAALSAANAIGGRVFQEAYDGDWVSYHLAARARGIRAYQFRAPGEWFAELYSAYHLGKLGPKHPSIAWLSKLNTESEAASK